MKPEYGSHGELSDLEALRQDEEITRMEHKEVQPQPVPDAGNFAPERPDQMATATLREACGKSNMEQSKTSTALPGLSVAQTEFFCALQERCAKYKLALTIGPDGEMFVCEMGGSNGGKSYRWGSIHDERNVFKLIPTMYDATLSRKEVISLMFKLFPRSTELSFLFDSEGGK